MKLGTIGEGVFVDHVFGVTDIFVILRVADISARYLEHFTEPLPRAA